MPPLTGLSTDQHSGGGEQLSGRPGVPPPALAAIVMITLVAIALLLITGGAWLPAGDELYFVVAGGHPSWGYADQQPLTPLLAHALHTVGHGSWALVRLPASILIPLGATAAALTARELGAGRRGQILALGAYLISPRVLNLSHTLTTGTLDLPLKRA